MSRPHLRRTTTPPTLAEYVRRTVAFDLYGWQHKLLCPLLERCLHEKGVRVAIHAPPRYGKSIIVSQRFPAWLLGCDPTHRVGLAMYNEDHATRFGGTVLGLMLEDQYREIFPGTVVRKDAPAGRFYTEARSLLQDGNPSLRAVGMLSGMVGFGADTWIVDDPYKGQEAAFSSVINEKVWRWWTDLQMRIAPDANVIMMFHRWHDDDLAGRALAQGGMEYYRLPSVADGGADDPTERAVGEVLEGPYDLAHLEGIRHRNPKEFLGLFQGKPRPDEGNILRREDFEFCEETPKLKIWVRYWDLAVSTEDSGDWTVGVMLGVDDSGRMYVRDVKRFRLEWPDARQIIVQTSMNDSAWAKSQGSQYHIGMDARATQLGFVQDMAANGSTRHIPIWPDKSRGNKAERAAAWQARARLFKVFLLDGFDRMAFISENLSFNPKIRDQVDDQVDAMSGAFALTWRVAGVKNEKQETWVDRHKAIERAMKRSR